MYLTVFQSIRKNFFNAFYQFRTRDRVRESFAVNNVHTGIFVINHYRPARECRNGRKTAQIKKKKKPRDKKIKKLHRRKNSGKKKTIAKAPGCTAPHTHARAPPPLSSRLRGGHTRHETATTNGTSQNTRTHRLTG